MRAFARPLAALCVAWSWLSPTAGAGEADVVAVEVTRAADGTYDFAVTVAHADEGWDHYADRWEILAPDGTVLAERVLAHPHVEEQPFTRNLTGVGLPDSLREVRVRARDNRHGYGGLEAMVELP